MHWTFFGMTPLTGMQPGRRVTPRAQATAGRDADEATDAAARPPVGDAPDLRADEAAQAR